MNNQNETKYTVSWGESLLALGPFLVFPALFLAGLILTPLINSTTAPTPYLGISLIFLVIGVLLKSTWRDWTLLSFAVYGAFPLMFLAAYDEVKDEAPILSALMLILAVGAFLYMRMQNIWLRLLYLAGSFFLSWLALMIHLSIYWNGRQEFWMPEPGSWLETLSWTGRTGTTLAVVLIAPAGIHLLRGAKKAIYGSRSANQRRTSST